MEWKSLSSGYPSVLYRSQPSEKLLEDNRGSLAVLRLGKAR